MKMFPNIDSVYVLVLFLLTTHYLPCDSKQFDMHGIVIDGNSIEIVNQHRADKPRFKFSLSDVTVVSTGQKNEPNDKITLSLKLSDNSEATLILKNDHDATDYTFDWTLNKEKEKLEICLLDSKMTDWYSEYGYYYGNDYKWLIDMKPQKYFPKSFQSIFGRFLKDFTPVYLSTDGFSLIMPIFEFGYYYQVPFNGESNQVNQCFHKEMPNSEMHKHSNIFSLKATKNIKTAFRNMAFVEFYNLLFIPNENFFFFPAWEFEFTESSVNQEIKYATEVTKNEFDRIEIVINFNKYDSNAKNILEEYGSMLGNLKLLEATNLGLEFSMLNSEKSSKNQPDFKKLFALLKNFQIYFNDIQTGLEVHNTEQAINFNANKNSLELISNNAIFVNDSNLVFLSYVNLQNLIPALLETSFLPYISNFPINGLKNDEEDYVRQVQARIFLPRMHFRTLPWVYSQETVELTKRYISMHTKFVPTIIELAKKMTQDGTPIYRAMWYAEPDDPRAYKIDDQFMLGDDIVVAPVVVAGQRNRKVYLPGGVWIDQHEQELKGPGEFNVDAPLDQLPYFIRRDIDQIITESKELPQKTSPVLNTTKEEWIDSFDNLTTIVDDFTSSNKKQDWNKTVAVTELSFGTMNNLIETPHVWSNFTNSEQTEQASKFMKMISKISTKLNEEQQNSSNDTNISSIDQKYSSILVQSNKFPTTNRNDVIKIDFPNELVFELPIQSLVDTKVDPFKKHETHIAATIVVVDKLPSYLAPKDNPILNSKLISVSVGNHDQTVVLKPPYKFKFASKNVNRLEFLDKPKCHYWDFVSSTWSINGCTYNRVESNRSFTVCECGHLTNFAALLDVSHREGRSTAKSVLTYIFSSLNCGCIVAAIFVALKYNRNDGSQNNKAQFKIEYGDKLTFNIAGCLLVSHLMVMFGMDMTSHPTMCGINSLILLFTLLCTFVFMFLFSFQYFAKHAGFSLNLEFKYYALVGYLLPGTIILISLLVIYFGKTHNVIDSMTGEYFCWVSSIRYPNHIWIFAVPATIVLFLNFGIFIFILSIILYPSQKNVTNRKELEGIFFETCRNIKQRMQEKRMPNQKDETKSDQVKRLIINNYFFIFNFGLPWLLYVFYINEYFRHFSYFFIVINGTQGIALFAQQVYIYYGNIAKQEEEATNRQNAAEQHREQRRKSS